MSDNTRLNAGTGGDLMRTEDDGTAKHSLVIMQWGGAGVRTRIEDSNTGRLPVKTQTASAGTRTQVADSATAVEILAANTNRKGALITNTSTVDLFIGLGTVDPTTTDWTARIPPDDAYEVPIQYTGQIKGIWASDPGTGGANVTELA